jgi:hypothetical protein
MLNSVEIRRGVPLARQRPGRNRSLAPALVFCILAFIVSAQTNSNTKVKHFRVPEYYEPPHEMQMKTLLSGAEAQPAPDGTILVSEAKLQTFAEDGRAQMEVEAPHCVFDSVRRSVSSPGPLRVRSTDGQLYLEGEGFFWQQTNSNLIISNRVHTTIRNPTARPPSP